VVGAHDPEPASTEGDTTTPLYGAAGVAYGCLMLIVDTMVKAAFISFWHIILSVIRLQAEF